MTQKQMILKDLNKGIEVTSLEAWIKYGCSCLPKRISEIITDGHRIKKEYKKAKTKFGQKRFMSYKLIKK